MKRILQSVVMVLLLTPVPALGQNQFGELTELLPIDANTLILINVEQAHASPIGQKQNWAAKHEDEFNQGLMIVPPHAKQFVMAAQMDFDFMHPIWQASVTNLAKTIDMAKVVAAHGGQADKLFHYETAMLPGDIYAVKFSDSVGGLYSPANRQKVARWLQSAELTAKPPMSPYLQEAKQFAQGGAPVILALDLFGVYSPQMIQSHIEDFESLKGTDIDPEKTSKALASIRGVMLGVTLSERRYGAIKVDFTEDVSFLAPVAKPLLLEILGRRGAMIEEFADWKVTVSGKQVQLEGILYESGMRRILSVLDPPPNLDAEPRVETPPSADPAVKEESLVVEATQKYFNSVESLIDDLRNKRQTGEFKTWGQVGIWFDKYARRIDKMPMVNVDPDMLDYGALVATSFRQCADAMRGIGAQSGYRQANMGNYYTTNTQVNAVGMTRWGVGGTYSWQTTPDLAAKGQERSRIRKEESIKGNMSANLIMQGVDQATADIRRHMVQKYNVNF